MARELLGLWDIWPLRRMHLRLNLRRKESPTSRIFWPVAVRNVDRIRRRRPRAHARPLSETIGPRTMEAGTVFQAPSDGEMLPAAQPGTLFSASI